jgi:hypothetical protein
MPPTWLIALAVVWLILSFLSAGFIVIDLVVSKPSLMPIMRWVWPITALSMGPLAIWAYWTMDRNAGKMAGGMPHMARPGNASQEPMPMAKQDQPFWQNTFKGTTHCGAGCTLGDIVAEWIIFFAAWQFAGRAIWPEYIGDYALAYLLGIAFQFFAIAPMRHLGIRDGLVAAIKADTLSLTAFEVGLFGWMALLAFVFFYPALHPDSVVYWFMMQVGMLIGFATCYPASWWLIRKGFKERM